MKEFLRMMRQYASPYKKYLGGAVVLNILSAIFNVFSFALVIPILNILFKINDTVYSFIPWDTEGMSIKDIAINNAYWFVSDFSASHGAIFALLLLSAVMIVYSASRIHSPFLMGSSFAPLCLNPVIILSERKDDKRPGALPVRPAPRSGSSRGIQKKPYCFRSTADGSIPDYSFASSGASAASAASAVSAASTASTASVSVSAVDSSVATTSYSASGASEASAFSASSSSRAWR